MSTRHAVQLGEPKFPYICQVCDSVAREDVILYANSSAGKFACCPDLDFLHSVAGVVHFCSVGQVDVVPCIPDAST